jgi:hypothetical protein
MSSFASLSSPLLPTSFARPNFHPCPSPSLTDPSTHVLLRESVLPSLAHLIRPAQLPPMPFTFPNGSILTAQYGGHLHFTRLTFPVPFWSALTLFYLTLSLPSLPSFKPLVLASSPPPHCQFLPQETRHPFLLVLNEPARMCGDSTFLKSLLFNPLIPCTFPLPLHHLTLPSLSTPPFPLSLILKTPPSLLISLALLAPLPTLPLFNAIRR